MKPQYLIFLQPGQVSKVRGRPTLTPKGVETMSMRADALAALIAHLHESIDVGAGAPSAFVCFAPTQACGQSADIVYERIGLHTRVERALHRDADVADCVGAMLAHDVHHILVVIAHRTQMEVLLPRLRAAMPAATVDRETHQGMVLIDCTACQPPAK